MFCVQQSVKIVTIAGQFTRLCKQPINADAKYVLNCLYNAGICSSGSSRRNKEYCIVHDHGRNWLFGYMLDNRMWLTDGLRSVPQEQVSFPNRNLRWLYSPDAEESDIDPMLSQKLREIGKSSQEIDKLKQIILDPNLFQVSMIFLSIHNDKSPTCFVFNRASRSLQSRASSHNFPSNRAMLMQSMFSTASAMQHFNRWVICLSSESTSLFMNQH